MHAIHRDISYDPALGDDGLGDLFLPDDPAGKCPVLLVHGGGWKGMTKEDFEFMAPIFCEKGHPVFNINYRLLGASPWPACGDDCLAAGRFLLSGGLQAYGLPGPRRILICGGSAGGHLAMMTGLRLPRERVAGILSLAGPSRIDWVASHHDPLGLCQNFIAQFFGRELPLDAAEVREASPALIVPRDPPPLFCFHSGNDQLVPFRHSEEACSGWISANGRAEVTSIDGCGNLHGFWINDDREGGELRPEVREFVHRVLSHYP